MYPTKYKNANVKINAKSIPLKYISFLQQIHIQHHYSVSTFHK